eukprot:408033_1
MSTTNYSCWPCLLTFGIGILLVVFSAISILNIIDIFKNTLPSITLIPINNNTRNDLYKIQDKNPQCEWYYNKDWWSIIPMQSNNNKQDIYPLDSAYNYSIPMIIDKKDPEITSHIVSNPRWHKEDRLPMTCKYNGKIFNIGIQKTGTTSISAALQWLGYQCNSLNSINMMKTCNNHQLTIGYKSHLRFHRSWRPFSADDISDAFVNKDYTKKLYLLSYISQVFADTPWAFFYKLWDKWYPNSKFIYTLRASTYNRVNSAAKFELRTRYMMAKRGLHGDTKQKLMRYVTRHINESKSILWKSDIENVIMPHDKLEEFVMLMARNYEKHHENILNYFGADRIGMDKDLLIICLECENDPWNKIFKFLGCEWKYANNGEIEKLNIPFPHELSAVKYMPKYYLPKDFSLNWREYEKYGKITKDVLNVIYNDEYTPMERLNNVAKYLWRFDMQRQRHLSRIMVFNDSYVSLGGKHQPMHEK